MWIHHFWVKLLHDVNLQSVDPASSSCVVYCNKISKWHLTVNIIHLNIIDVQQQLKGGPTPTEYQRFFCDNDWHVIQLCYSQGNYLENSFMESNLRILIPELVDTLPEEPRAMFDGRFHGSNEFQLQKRTHWT
jgi:hypothetical protein